MPPTLFQAAASASYWFLVDCGPGLYSEPEFGPMAANTTGDLDAPEPELAVLAALAAPVEPELAELGGLDELDDELLEQAATASVAVAARAAMAVYLYLVFLLMPRIPFHCTVTVCFIRSPLARRALAAGPRPPVLAGTGAGGQLALTGLAGSKYGSAISSVTGSKRTRTSIPARTWLGSQPVMPVTIRGPSASSTMAMT
jgi:hypothetical protein